ncbi:MAG: hypothetical protein KAH25_10165, partial [Bacteroidales bacterium]|nr:hypothetical protein [Bacteroidales bacterium]
VVKDMSTSQWGTIVAMAESPVKEGLLYVGTDDGLIQISDDDGESWTKVSAFPNVPEYTYVSDLEPSKFDENVVFASFNNTKSDDFKPYVLKSSDKGRTWVSINNNLPENGNVHTIAQDFIKEDLLFVGTEFAFFFSIDGGQEWKKLSSGMPDVAVRDIAIQQRESDLAIATFGRGFYILDDYSPLREVEAALFDKEAYLFPISDALMYSQSGSRYGQGSTPYYGENPKFGAVFTYYIKEVPKTIKQDRKKKEKEQFKNGEKIPMPTNEELKIEERQQSPYIVFTIKDDMGNIVKEQYKNASEGIQQEIWNLRYNSMRSVSAKEFNTTKNKNTYGYPIMPGKYSVSISMVFGGEKKLIAGPVEFTAKTLNNTTLPAEKREELVAFQKQVTEIMRVMNATEKYGETLENRVVAVQQTIHNTLGLPDGLGASAQKIANQLDDLKFTFEGASGGASWEEVPPQIMPLSNRVQYIAWGMWGSTSQPTQTMIDNYAVLIEELPKALTQMEQMNENLKAIEKQLDAHGAPWTPGRIPVFKK